LKIARLIFLFLILLFLGPRSVKSQDSLKLQWQKLIDDRIGIYPNDTPFVIDKQSTLYLFGDRTSVFLDTLGNEKWKLNLQCTDIKIASDGDLILLHENQITKMALDSTIKWTITYAWWITGPPDTIQTVEAIAVDDSNNVYAFGHLYYNGYIFWVTRYNPQGKSVWTLREDFRDSGGISVKKILWDRNKDIIFCSFQGVLIKVDKKGRMLWRIFTYKEMPDCAIDSENNIIIGAGSISKYNPHGNLLWQSSIDSSNIRKIAIDSHNFIYAAGERRRENYRTDSGLWKFGPDGSVLWVSFYDGMVNNDDRPTAILLDRNGSIYIAGSECTGWPLHNVSNYFLLQYNSAGHLQATARKDISTNDNPVGLAFWGESRLLMIGSSSRDDDFLPQIVLFSFPIVHTSFVAAKHIERGMLAIAGFPNPFNEELEISYAVPVSSEIVLNVYNITGSHVFSDPIGFREAGRHTYHWIPAHLPTGNYFIEIRTKDQRVVFKAALLK